MINIPYIGEVSILTFSGWIAFIITSAWGLYTQIKAIKLQAEVDILKSKEILNDEKIRKAYEDFIDLVFKTIHKQVDETTMENRMLEFMKQTLLFASSDTIKSFSRYRRYSQDPNKVLKVFGELILAMRKELGTSNKSLDYKDILQVFIKDDIRKILK